MGDDPTCVDEPHAMTTELRYHPYDELAELLVKAAGRFGRDARTIACADPELAPARTTEVMRMRERMKKSGYDVDPRLVAAAILERLSAGGVTPPGGKQ
jgi:hypothetical protein